MREHSGPFNSPHSTLSVSCSLHFQGKSLKRRRPTENKIKEAAKLHPTLLVVNITNHRLLTIQLISYHMSLNEVTYRLQLSRPQFAVSIIISSTNIIVLTATSLYYHRSFINRKIETMHHRQKRRPSKKTTPIITHWPKRSVLLHSGLRTDYYKQAATTFYVADYTRL